MKRTLAVVVAVGLMMAGRSFAAAVPAAGPAVDDKPNFSGTWTLDPSKSQMPTGAGRQGRAGRGGQAARGGRAGRAAALGIGAPEGPITITQTESDITIGTQIYKVDGTPYAIGGGRRAAGGKGTGGGKGAAGGEATARWDGSKLVIETTRTLQGTTLKTTEIRSLEADGKEMHVEITQSTPRGEFKTRQVFTKATSSSGLEPR
jgi:hypothetical protein